MKSTAQLLVSINLDGKKIEVGELASDGKKIYFKYHPSFIETGLQISPFKLPLSSEILTAETPIFDGLFGVFNDSLPDGWGRLLFDRTLMARGISLNEITPLDRLSFVGHNGMGALAYQPAIDSKPDIEKLHELDEIASEARKILEGTSSEVIEELYHMGGSSGGARPKILVGYHQEKDHIIHGQEILPEGYEHWIIKFGSFADPNDIAEIEHAYHKMAVAAGIEMSTCRLFRGVSGKHYFGTKRFDRVGDKRLHMHSAAGLMHDNFRLSNLDYGHVMDAAFRLENHVGGYEKVLRLAAFNVFAQNRDDHSKNISFLMNSKGEWKLAPAYDLTFSTSSHGHHSTTVAGESRSPGSKQLYELADIFSVKNAHKIIEEVKEATKNWKQFANKCGVKTNSKKLIDKSLRELRDK